jgi:hypothetical protein
MSPRDVQSCRNCRHFDALAADIEANFPGLASLSSAYSSVRAGDGLCALNDRYIAASSVCERHTRQN